MDPKCNCTCCYEREKVMRVLKQGASISENGRKGHRPRNAAVEAGKRKEIDFSLGTGPVQSSIHCELDF